jgi:hypothetical protein
MIDMGIIPPEYHVSYNNTVFYPKKKGFFSLFLRNLGFLGAMRLKVTGGIHFYANMLRFHLKL